MRYLLVKGFSGMGNRLHALAEAIIYARLCDRRLVIDWNDRLYSPDGQDVFHRLFASPEADTIGAVPRDASVAPAIWSRQLEKSFDRMVAEHGLPLGTEARAQLSIDPDRDYEETVAVLYDYTFRLPRLSDRPVRCPDEWHGLDTTALLRTLLRQSVRPNARIAARVERFVRRHFTRPTIGVHVRQSDNMSARHLGRKGVSVSALDAALARVLLRAPDATIFVATDNRAVEDNFRRRYERVVVYPKWYPRTPGEPLHGHRERPNTVAVAEDALLDLYLLSLCDFLIYSFRATTFAQCAAYISQQPPERHVDVDQSPLHHEAARWIRRRPWWNTLPRRVAGGVARRLRRSIALSWPGRPAKDNV